MHYPTRAPMGDPYPYQPYPPCCTPQPILIANPAPSIQEQLGIDPVSKLATAIDRLAAALECSALPPSSEPHERS